MGGLVLCADDLFIFLDEGRAVYSWPFRRPRERFFVFLDVGRLRQEKTHTIVSSILYVPTESVEYRREYFEYACDIVVERLMVFDSFEGLARRRAGSNGVGDYFNFIRCPFSMDCV